MVSTVIESDLLEVADVCKVAIVVGSEGVEGRGLGGLRFRQFRR
jgi:hypothetical protein